MQGIVYFPPGYTRFILQGLFRKTLETASRRGIFRWMPNERLLQRTETMARSAA